MAFAKVKSSQDVLADHVQASEERSVGTGTVVAATHWTLPFHTTFYDMSPRAHLHVVGMLRFMSLT